jgi:hypothetical protein
VVSLGRSPGEFQTTMSQRHRAPQPLPQDTPVHEVLHREATNMTAKKAALRAAYEEDNLRECTFAPKLVAEQLVSTGRVMRVRSAVPCRKQEGQALKTP